MFLLFLLALLALIIPASADLPRYYQSDDADLMESFNSTDLNEIAEHTDILFLKYPSAVSEQNRRFISSFPSTGDDESVIPLGVQTESSDVIRDAYIKLIPVNGLIKTPSAYYADKEVTIGYVADYRIVLPPDDDEGDVRYYYSLKGASITVEVEGKVSGSKKDVFTVHPTGNTIEAKAEIKAVINVRKEVDVEVTRNNTTYIVTHVYHYTQHHSLSVADNIPLEFCKPSDVYMLKDEKGILEYWVFPNRFVAEIRSNGTAVGGLMSFLTYRTVKDAVIKPLNSHEALSEPAYEVLALPAYQLTSNNVAILDRKVEEAEVSLEKDFTVGSLYRVKALRISFTKNIELVDAFGNVLSCNLHEKYYLRPDVDVKVEDVGDKYAVTIRISATEEAYSGPVYVTAGRKQFTPVSYTHLTLPTKA